MLDAMSEHTHKKVRRGPLEIDHSSTDDGQPFEVILIYFQVVSCPPTKCGLQQL